MTVKELRDKLSEYPDDRQVVIRSQSSSMAIEIDSIKGIYSWDKYEPPMVGIFYDL